MVEEGSKIARKAIRTSYVSSVVSIALVLFMAGILVVLLMNARRVSDYFRESFQVSMFLEPDAGDRPVQELVRTVGSWPGVKSAVVISKEEAAQALSEELGEDFIAFIGSNPLSSVIDVRFLSDYAQTDSIAAFTAAFGKNKLVQEIRYEQSLVDNINRNIRKLSLFILGFCALLFFVMTVLVNNTIRLTLYAKRLLIKSMQLVGATRGFIRRPFLWQGVQSGFYGALVANVMLAILLFAAKRQVPEIFGVSDFRLMATLVLAVFAAGIIISVISTFFAVNKYLRRRYDEIF